MILVREKTINSPSPARQLTRFRQIKSRKRVIANSSVIVDNEKGLNFNEVHRTNQNTKVSYDWLFQHSILLYYTSTGIIAAIDRNSRFEEWQKVISNRKDWTMKAYMQLYEIYSCF